MTSLAGRIAPAPEALDAPPQPRFLWRRIQRLAPQYAFALLAMATALGLSYLLDAFTSAETTLILLIAVIAVSWFADFRSALVAVALATAGSAVIVYDPTFSPGIDTTTDTLRLLLFVAVAPPVALSVEAVRRSSAAREAALRRASELNRALREANDSKDAFVSLVSHELRTPATVIAGNADVLRRHPDLAAADRDAALADIAREASRLSTIIEDLLMLARIDRGVTLPLEPLLLSHEVEAVVRDHNARPGARCVSVRVNGRPQPALGSSVYLRQILQNLISNAEKYTPAGSPIEVSVSTTAGAVSVSVRDHGPGIPQDELERIFEPFFRSSTASSIAGMGVGLAVCKRLVEAQSGTITAANAAGGGAEFSFSLPLAP